MRKKGFTLIELLASIAIITLLAGLLVAIFSINIKASEKAVDEELSFKESTIAMTYIDNAIKSAYKIELMEENNQTNLMLYVLDKHSNQIVSVYFMVDKAKDNKTYLYAVRDNLSNNSEKDGKVRIAQCQDLYLKLDKKTSLVNIIINKDNPKNRQQTKIYLGDRL